MATMIPADLPNGANQFEKDLFKKFKKVPAEWKVFPNFILNRSDGDLRPRELDFVILIEKYKAVVYLEAKSGRFEVKDRQWYRNEQKSPIDPSPPDQARTGMFALKNTFLSFLKQNPDLGSSRLLFCHAVVFAHWDVSDEARNSEDINRGALLLGNKAVQNGNSIVQAINGYVKRMRQQIDSMEQWTDKQRRNGASQLRRLEETLNPPETAVTKSTFYSRNLETLLPELLEPTAAQDTVLELVTSNDRCVIDGAAGTGKTVLAMEVARQRCEDGGETVGMLCSNPNLSNRFERWAEALSQEKGGKVLAGTPGTLPYSMFGGDETLLDRHRRRVESTPGLEGTLQRGELDDGWGAFVADTLADFEGKAPVFDYLIVDEAQNLCDDEFLSLMDHLLKGGLTKGRWSMFGDFVNQNIVTPRRQESGNAKKMLDSRGAFYTNVSLRTNCRNTFEIAEATYDITDITSPTLPGVHGPKVEFKYFESDSGDKFDNMLSDQLNLWEGYGFETQQIILLTADEDALKRKYGKWDLVNVREVLPGSDIRVSEDDSSFIRYSAIHDFQGLESDLVIVILPLTKDQSKINGNITLPYHDYLNRLLYIALSRANAMLVVMADSGYRVHLSTDAQRNSFA